MDEGTLLTVGSGMSCAEGIPGMSELASELEKQIPKVIDVDDGQENDIWSKVQADLLKGVDLETSLNINHSTEKLDQKIKEVTFSFLNEKNCSIIEEALCKNWSFKISSIINALFPRNSQELTVITTNYDLLIEFSCFLNNIDVDSMFYGSTILSFGTGNYAYRHLKKSANKKKHSIVKDCNFVKLLKPHGSLNWRLLPTGQIVMDPINTKENVEIIIPGVSKFERERREPYNEIYNLCNKSIDSSERYIFLGYGFNDKDMQDHYENAKNKEKPILVITKEITNNIRELFESRETIMLIYEATDGAKIEYKRKDLNKIELEVAQRLWDVEEMIKVVINGSEN